MFSQYTEVMLYVFCGAVKLWWEILLLFCSTRSKFHYNDTMINLILINIFPTALTYYSIHNNRPTAKRWYPKITTKIDKKSPLWDWDSFIHKASNIIQCVITRVTYIAFEIPVSFLSNAFTLWESHSTYIIKGTGMKKINSFIMFTLVGYSIGYI